MNVPFRPLLAATAISMLGAAPGAAQALEWTGYFRAGPGLTSSNTSRACYALNTGTKGLKYRLGNECDFYGEFQLSQDFKKDGIEYRATLMTNLYNAGTDTDGKSLNIEQMWAEAKGFDVAPEATFWIGKERGRRGDVHIVDTFFIEMAGVGAGAKGFNAGPGKLGVAFYKTEHDATHPGNRLNVEYLGVPTNEGGALNLFFTATKGQFTGGTSGYGFTARHDQSKLFGTSLNNMIWLQFAAGSAALNANFGDLASPTSSKSWRIVESINWQSGPFGGQALAIAASEQDALGVKTKSGTLGGRISYALSRNFKMLAELGVSQAKPDGGETQRLTKLTIAPTLSVGPDFWSRPEVRLYVTTAKWNAAAGNVTGQPAFANKTSGTSYGAQVEWWF
ncbi:MAG TPA: carbohydrate porin [Albitalea sp.]|nr:carbohydrate porin [Albitalea sp.]